MKTLIYGALLSLFFLFACTQKKEKASLEIDDFEIIKERKELVVLTLYSSVSYFIYRGEEMGYEYDLVKSYAESQGLSLKIKVADNVNQLTEMLEAKEGDLIAFNIPISNQMKENILYCGQESINEQVLVQRANKKDTLIKDVTQMIGKEVYVVANSKFDKRLSNLNQELGGGIIIKTIDKDTISVEDLIGLVATTDNEIIYTLSDKNIARLNKTYHPNINYDLAISHPQRSSWAVRLSGANLAASIDEWFKNYKKQTNYSATIKRYFERSKLSQIEGIPILDNGNISIFDNMFKHYATQISWDWRLLSSIAYQESRFDTAGVSWAGAVGLMGLMPRTAENFGLDANKRTNPEGNIKASIEYIRSLEKAFTRVEDAEEKKKFILASYNAGLGHIKDAQALARKLNKNPYIWEANVEECLKLKSLPEFYNDSVCKQGYFRGSETFDYVKQVIKRWKYYEQKVQL